MARVELLRPRLDACGIAALEAEWRSLESRAGGTLFQGWTWVGCLARERFPQPVLLRATAEGRTVGLALFNERRRFGLSTLWLGESGDPALDRVFVEHNGILAEAGWAGELPAWLEAAMRLPLPGASRRRRLILGGIDARTLAAARQAGTVRVSAVRQAPFVDLTQLGPAGDGFLDELSRNARQQLRRSDRLYGALQVRRAATPGEAESFLRALLELHMGRWAASGRESSLAQPLVARFIRELVARGAPLEEVDVLRVTAGEAPRETAVGYLLNLRRGGWVGQYQGGFDFASAGPHQKPGLTCHHAAIRYYCAQAAGSYDFLAGEDRYKRSLAGGWTELHWAEAAPPLSLYGVVTKIRGTSMTK